MHELEQIRESVGISKTEMARKLGISKSNYSMIIHGQHGLSKKVALQARKEFGISLEELLCPQVQPEKTDEEAATLDTDQPTGTEGRA